MRNIISKIIDKCLKKIKINQADTVVDRLTKLDHLEIIDKNTIKDMIVFYQILLENVDLVTPQKIEKMGSVWLPRQNIDLAILEIRSYVSLIENNREVPSLPSNQWLIESGVFFIDDKGRYIEYSRSFELLEQLINLLWRLLENHEANEASATYNTRQLSKSLTSYLIFFLKLFP